VLKRSLEITEVLRGGGRRHARQEPQRGPRNHYHGGLSQPHSVCAERE